MLRRSEIRRLTVPGPPVSATIELHRALDRVDGPEVDEHPLRGGSENQSVDLLDGEHLRQRVDVLQFEHPNDLPVAFKGMGEEELHAGKCNFRSSESWAEDVLAAIATCWKRRRFFDMV